MLVNPNDLLTLRLLKSALIKIQVPQNENGRRDDRANILNPILTVVAACHRCFSSVGDQQTGQILSLGSGCDHKAVIEHELLHALGFYHEQSRTDRDDYVDIWLDQVLPGESTAAHRDVRVFPLQHLAIYITRPAYYQQNGLPSLKYIGNPS